MYCLFVEYFGLERQGVRWFRGALTVQVGFLLPNAASHALVRPVRGMCNRYQALVVSQ